MKVTVRLFARARELANADQMLLELADMATVGELRRRIAIQLPSLSGLLDRSALAIHDEFADDEQIIPPDAEVALVPPVSGG